MTLPAPAGAAPEPPLIPADPVAPMPLSDRTAGENELGVEEVALQAATPHAMIANTAIFEADMMWPKCYWPKRNGAGREKLRHPAAARCCRVMLWSGAAWGPAGLRCARR